MIDVGITEEDSINTSGQGALAAVPAEVARWNWGAFLLNWIWGVGNNTFIALLMFIPVVNFFMPFVLGFKGSVWAWRNKRWRSVQHFKSVQKKWALWAVAFYLGIILVGVGATYTVGHWVLQSNVYVMAHQRLEENAQVQALFGQPIHTGFPSGSFQTSGPDGQASFQMSVSGPKGSGTAYVQAIRKMGAWKIHQLVVEDAKTGRRINLLLGA